MAAQKGKLVLLKADTAGGSPQVYTTIAGLRTNTWTINGEDVDVTTKDDDGWQQRLSGAGVRSINISATARPTCRATRMWLSPRNGTPHFARPGVPTASPPARRPQRAR